MRGNPLDEENTGLVDLAILEGDQCSGVDVFRPNDDDGKWKARLKQFY